MKQWTTLVFLTTLMFTQTLFAQPSQSELTVWTNEAIIATYTFDYQNILQEQKNIAKYFTAQGWQAYSQALSASGLLDTVQKNNYYVSSVATFPPEIKSTSATSWEAKMPILVVYKNPQYQQKQSLDVTITFNQVNAGGVRGLAISSLNAKVSTPPCECKKTK